jgi:hypothetical protein
LRGLVQDILKNELGSLRLEKSIALWYAKFPEQIINQRLTRNAVPGSSQKMLNKSRSLNVDLVAYDLEDSVAPHSKHEARFAVRDFLMQPKADNIREQAVRINAVDSGYALQDLTEVVSIINGEMASILINDINTYSA